MKTYSTTWLLFTILTFLLYDAIWFLVDFEGAANVITDGSVSVGIDLAYCSLFAIMGITTSWCLLRYDVLRNVKQRKSMILGIMLLLVNMILAFLIENIIDRVVAPARNSIMWDNAYVMGLISSLLSLMFTVEHYNVQAIRQQNENQTLRMQLFKSQLNPHFIFNSLSVLVSLISIDPKKAEKYTIRLSRIYRYILNHMDKETVTIQEALDFAKDYMYLLHLRFENIDLHIEKFEHHDNEFVLSLSLQLLIENAIKHNSPTQGETLYIWIQRIDDTIVVSNNLIQSAYPLKSRKLPSNGIGLANLRKRYLVGFNREIVISEDNGNFEVRLPIIVVKNNDTKKNFSY